jgi:hypothetical protein
MEELELAEFKPNTAKAVQFQRVDQWSGRRDSNPRPSAPKADALPDCATPRRVYLQDSPDCNANRIAAEEGARMRFPQPCWMLQSVRHGGYSSAAERLTVAQDVVGSIPTSRPKLYL